MELFTLWLWPLLALVLLPGLLVYLGLHVVERGVIFVDLALAQVAALGVAVAILMGGDPEHGLLPYAMALLFTFLGAGIFSLTRFRHSRVPQEAFIGIVYIVSAAAAVVVLSKTAEGDEAIKNLLVGNILLVTQREVLQAFALSLLLGLFHFVFRRRFLEVSFDEEGARTRGVPLRLWDFLFYVTFGFAVTSFVLIAGVYLVFSYLIVPAVCGALLSERIGRRLLIGWAVALTAGLAGLLLSTQWTAMDLPTGPTIVCLFGLLLLVAGAIAWTRGSRARSQDTGNPAPAGT
ncbi:MAG: metal ABC transporter permease [Thermoanaerobaculia bacterium]